MRMTWLVFFVSGFAALLYQVVWQRSLFAIFGINIESVTVVVTAFMLGLGLGSLFGGAISGKPDRPALLVFAAIEGGIGVFGLLSLWLFRVVGEATLGAPPLVTATVTFLLVLVPTMLMGSTLPVLVAHLVRRWTNVGSSVGALYFVNTLGSALASFAAVLFLLGKLGQHGTVDVAAACNFTASALALREHFRAA
jgi:spermidine synthase